MKKILIAAVLTVLFSGAAQADTYVWKDKENGFTLSFPDSWTIQTVDTPSTRLRIAGPVWEDAATCRVKAEKDGRAKIYPKELMMQAVYEKLDRAFWEHEVNQYQSAVVTDYIGPSNVGGQGDATAIKAYFVQDNGAGKQAMYGDMVGTLYGDTRYVVGCTCKASEYQKYATLFTSIMQSIQLEAKYHPFVEGYYRNFLIDKRVIVPNGNPGTPDASPLEPKRWPWQ